MKQSDVINMAEKVMRGIIRMSRNPLVSRRGNIMVKNFLDTVNAVEPKKKKAVDEVE